MQNAHCKCLGEPFSDFIVFSGVSGAEYHLDGGIRIETDAL